MKAIIIHTFEDDGTERIQEFRKEDFADRVTKILAGEASTERKSFIQCREATDGKVAVTVVGNPTILLGYIDQILKNVSEGTGIHEVLLLEMMKTAVIDREKRQHGNGKD